MTEIEAIQQLSRYPKTIARIKTLSEHNVGNGITVSRLNADDQLQELHRKLRGLPSYMYLTKREQRLESVAHAYMTRYPSGSRAQLGAVPNPDDEETTILDDEDAKLLRELRKKIKRVIEARAGHVDDYEAVIARLSELQDLEAERDRVTLILETLDRYKPDHARLLRLRYCEGLKWDRVGAAMHISRTTCYRLYKEAIVEFLGLIK